MILGFVRNGATSSRNCHFHGDDDMFPLELEVPDFQTKPDGMIDNNKKPKNYAGENDYGTQFFCNSCGLKGDFRV